MAKEAVDVMRPWFLGVVSTRLLGVVAVDDLGEVGSALLFSGRDGVGVEAGFGGGVDPRDLGPQGGDPAVGVVDVRARRMASGVVRATGRSNAGGAVEPRLR
ncbi:hypothetical protein J2Z21_006801 [Streptomyces griseochromogenes]|uniref:Uncharacterized protein n=1 Tax=Streptomyces griseochromogenes TaxID=68214 RepID=A0ABS4M2A6_9ACTN|nr:hypothetical protein [Streptomyces griseochromogenes]MBP2053799.1 hypothetical protein [Streptomyces griseochromogenes]